jgi:hypothetical protein
MTRFVQLTEQGEVVSERDIPQDMLRACPHGLMAPEHYRADNSCRCDDPKHVTMRSWGYVWSDGLWVIPDELAEELVPGAPPFQQ